jgi:hypothetical protein
VKYSYPRLIQISNECELHIKRLNSAYNKMQVYMPLSADSFLQLNDDEIEHIDQYLFRFAKLQDAIGQRLFKSMLEYLGEVIIGKSFIDIFNKLEQLNIIENYNIWMKLRIVRNELAHVYDNDPEENASEINKIYSMKDNLESYYFDVKKYLEKM